MGDATTTPAATSEVADLLRREREATREACALLVLRIGERNLYCPRGCRCADPAHLAAAIRGMRDGGGAGGEPRA